MEAFWLLVIVTILLCIYYIPFLVADSRKIKNRRSVFWLNTFFGLSGIGWIALLFYSSLNNEIDEDSGVVQNKTKKIKKRSKN
tara:strand:- start:118 stop:366 length:249 start_codon:yes stop_codon:yes gene_type:complete